MMIRSVNPNLQLEQSTSDSGTNFVLTSILASLFGSATLSATGKETKFLAFAFDADSERQRKSLMDATTDFEINVHIRWMIRRDMPEVLAIENGSFEFAWSEDDFIRCLRQRNCIGMVAEYDERVVGFMIYELHKDQLHVLNFAVRPDVRRRGVGRQMVEKLIGKLSQQRRNRVLLEIRETNLAAQVFFRNLGFMATSVLRDYYDDTTEDAYVMQYRYREQEALPIESTNRITRLAG